MPDDVRRPAIDKSRLPSRHVTVGPERAPHRAFLYSMGLTAEQISQPLVGVATTWNGISLVLRRQRAGYVCIGHVGPKAAPEA
jgi:dihydroxyacid dehydratase/phosphogluconate dehydratase